MNSLVLLGITEWMPHIQVNQLRLKFKNNSGYFDLFVNKILVNNGCDYLTFAVILTPNFKHPATSGNFLW